MERNWGLLELERESGDEREREPTIGASGGGGASDGSQCAEGEDERHTRHAWYTWWTCFASLSVSFRSRFSLRHGLHF